MCPAESSLSQNLLFLRNMCQTPLAQEKHTSGKADYAILMSQVWFRPAKRNTCWVYRLTPVLMAIRNLDKQGSPGSRRFWTTTPTTHSAEGNSQPVTLQVTTLSLFVSPSEQLHSPSVWHLLLGVCKGLLLSPAVPLHVAWALLGPQAWRCPPHA